jgi:hypothetical protein
MSSSTALRITVMRHRVDHSHVDHSHVDRNWRAEVVEKWMEIHAAAQTNFEAVSSDEWKGWPRIVQLEL